MVGGDSKKDGRLLKHFDVQTTRRHQGSHASFRPGSKGVHIGNLKASLAEYVNTIAIAVAEPTPISRLRLHDSATPSTVFTNSLPHRLAVFEIHYICRLNRRERIVLCRGPRKGFSNLPLGRAGLRDAGDFARCMSDIALMALDRSASAQCFRSCGVNKQDVPMIGTQCISY